jgi:MFS transporter, AAHS family, benzoate transport protein
MTIESVIATDQPLSFDVEISARTSLLVAALCWTGIFTEGYDVGVLGAILPAVATDPSWRLTSIELGALGSWTLFGMVVGGILSDLYGREPLFIGCFTLFTVCAIITAFTPTPAWFGFSRLVGGLGLGGIIPVAAALTIEYSPARRKSFNYGIMYSGYSVGILAAALVGRAPGTGGCA